MNTKNDPTSPAATSESDAATETTTEGNNSKKLSLSIFDIRKRVDAKVETPETTEQVYEALVQRRADAIIADRVNLLDTVEKKMGELNGELKKIKPDLGEEFDEKGKKTKEHDRYSKEQAEKRAAVYAKIKKIEDQLNPILSGNGNKENWVKLIEAVK